MERRVQVGLQNYWIEGGNLTISPIQTLGKRTKIKTFQLLKKGTYTWRLFVS
jgi:hypothetical protein